jgi:enamine deaminase RidA (YjgF/YER057c/UK114 family)
MGMFMQTPLRRRGVLAAAMVLSSACAVAGLAGRAGAVDVERLPLPDGNPFPIAAAVTVPAGFDMVFVSGALPAVADKEAPKGSVQAYGDMETQAVSALSAIKASLARLGLGMGDVVKMTVFMVADPTKDNKLDFAGLMAGYSQFFGTPEQPNKPARSAVQVAALVAPGALLEIEVIAAKPHKGKAKPHKGKHKPHKGKR